MPKTSTGPSQSRGFLAGWVSAGLLAILGLMGHGRTAVASAQDEFFLTGNVVHVSDGDSFTINVDGQRKKIRLASIDAPELGGPDRPGQPLAREARKALAVLIHNNRLTLRCFEQDHHGRSICDAPLPGGRSASRELVRQGFAWANTERRGQFMRDDSLPALEREARNAGRGIWGSGARAVQPWVWRYECWKQSQC